MIITYSDLVNFLKNNSTPNKTLRILDEHIMSTYDMEWAGAYNDNDSVDWILQYFYGAFVVDGVSTLNEGDVVQELKNRTHVFLLTFGDSLNRLYKELLLEFDPIENYNRKEDTANIYTPEGEELNVRNNLGDDTTSHTITAYNNNSIDSDKIAYNSSVNEKKGFDNRKDTTKITSSIHGNIGVTTAPQMLKEYDAYYVNQSFWLKFWKMYLTLFSKGVFE